MDIKEVEVYDNGVVKIIFNDGESMLIDKVYYTESILNGWNENDVGIKK